MASANVDESIIASLCTFNLFVLVLAEEDSMAAQAEYYRSNWNAAAAYEQSISASSYLLVT